MLSLSTAPLILNTCPSRIRAYFRTFFWEGVSQNRFLSDPGPNRCFGRINTTTMHGISTRIQWDQCRGLKPRFPGKKSLNFLIGVRILLGRYRAWTFRRDLAEDLTKALQLHITQHLRRSPPCSLAHNCFVPGPACIGMFRP